MSMQARADNKNFPFILSGNSFVRDNETILTDGARSTVLKFGTVMAQVAATGKWVPQTSLTATDGTCTARGIYVGADIAAAALVAGDVVGCPILVGGGCSLDSQQVVLENSLTLASVVGGTTINARTVRDDLVRCGIFVESTVDIGGLET